MSLVLKFEPKTIEHLGVKMYSTLPPALAELISNSYDADASDIKASFHEKNGDPVSITVKDNGYGMSFEDIQNKFLSIGRDRRKSDGDRPSPKYGRLPTGKKGLGKLALFGIAKEVTIDTIKDGRRNRFVLDWDTLLSSDREYSPAIEIENQKVDKANGTTISLRKLKRKSRFDIESIADGLSRIFIVEEDFKIKLIKTDGLELEEIDIDAHRRYDRLEKQFSWGKNDIDIDEYNYSKDIEFCFITSEKPIAPSSGLRGVTIFSRGKLVNAPDFFSDSTSSHFFSYLTGWVKADFIDLLDEDVISTNRQSLNWDHEEMADFRKWLQSLISKVKSDWSRKRKNKKENEFKDRTGIDKERWMSSLPENVRKPAEKIIGTLSKDDAVDDSFNPVIFALHEIIPEYPELHWRHLHDTIKSRIKPYYENKQFAEAADQGTKVYAEILRNLSGKQIDGTDLASLFSAGNKQAGSKPDILVADINTKSGWNIQEGQSHLTRGVMAGFRNPMNHQPFDVLVPGTFSQLDCLNILSLISYLTSRLDYSAPKGEASENRS